MHLLFMQLDMKCELLLLGLSTHCLSNITARDQISKASPLHICMLASDQILEVGTAWEQGYCRS